MTHAEFTRVERPVIYFAMFGEHIKIGYATRLSGRLAALQCSSPYPLCLLGVVGGRKGKERILHQRFHAHHVRGEWYRAADEIIAYATQNGRSHCAFKVFAAKYDTADYLQAMHAPPEERSEIRLAVG